MIPTAVTFVDNKYLHLAKEQKENFNKFGVNHVIINMDEVNGYTTNLWIKLLELSKDAVLKYGKIFRVDAEVRMHKPIPKSWIDADNVLFYFTPLIKNPVYVAINTGHMILSNKGNGIEFIDTLKECILASIPPDNDTRLESAGVDQQIEDEYPSAIAIRLSKINHLKETLCTDRRIDQGSAATRGLWVTENTIITHPGIHNWTSPGCGKWLGKYFNNVNFINHFSIDDLKKAQLVSKLCLERVTNKSIWSSMSSKVYEDNTYEIDNWIFDPSLGLCAPKEFWRLMPKELVI